MFGLLSAALMVSIFCFSAQPADESMETSNGFLYWLLSPFDSFFRSEEQKAALIEFLRGYIRKAAHFTEYAMLGCALTLFFAGLRKTVPGAVLPALPVGVLYAATDEWHQTFVAGRSGEFRDVLIDSAGLACGAAIACLLLLLYLRRRKRQKTDDGNAR